MTNIFLFYLPFLDAENCKNDIPICTIESEMKLFRRDKSLNRYHYFIPINMETNN